MRFKEFYLNEAFSQWEYHTSDIYSAIYDFYALSLVYPEKIHNENLKYAFKEAKDTIIKYMTKFLLEQLERAVAAEISHYTQFKKPEGLLEYTPRFLKTPSLKDFYKKYITEFSKDRNGNILKDGTGKLMMRTEILSNDRAYDEIYRLTLEFLKKNGYSIADLFTFGRESFNDLTGWRSDQFGGSAWTKIAQAGLDVLESKNNRNANERMAVLDHVFDLQHNNGTIFTKNPSLDINKIHQILDDKRDITNEAAYYFKVSPALKSAWAAVIKDLFNKTIESEEQKINKQETIAFIKRNPFEIKTIENPSKELQQIAINTDPYSVVYINNPDIDILKQALEYDIEIFKHLKPEVKNKIPKDIIEELFGTNWSSKENSDKEDSLAFKEI